MISLYRGFNRHTTGKLLPRIGLAFTVLTTACVGATSPAIRQALANAPAGTSVECDAPCTTEWQRAQAWIGKHAMGKVETATDALLKTAGYYDHTVPNYDFLLVREPLPSGRYRISVQRAQCNRGALSECSPLREDVVKAVLYYVTSGTDVLDGHVAGGDAIR